MNKKTGPWFGVDLDATLAFHDKWQGPTHIGEPIPAMLERVKRWIAEGRRVKIMTARVAPAYDDLSERIAAIEAWLEEHGIGGLEITHEKDQEMLLLYDDKAVQMIPNTGERADGKADMAKVSKDIFKEAQKLGLSTREIKKAWKLGLEALAA